MSKGWKRETMIRKKQRSLYKLVPMRMTRDRKENDPWIIKGIFRILVEESPEIPRIRLVKGVRAAAIKMMAKTTLEVKRRGLTKSKSSALSVKGTIILQESEMQTRRNLKKMKPRLQDKSLMKRIHSWTWSRKEIAVAADNGTTSVAILGMLQKQDVIGYMIWLASYMQTKMP